MLVGFDTEFSFESVRWFGSYPHGDVTTQRPVCACLYFEDGQDLRFVDQWEALQAYLDDPQYTFVVHGAHAEYGFCKLLGLRFPVGHYYDTLLMAVLLAHASSFIPHGKAYKQARLANLTARYGIPFLADDKDKIRTSIMVGKHVEEYGMKRVLDYCRDDAKATVQLFRPLCEDMVRTCGANVMKNLVNLYQPYSLVMADAQRKGTRFDGRGWDRLITVAPRYRERLLTVMRAAGYDYDGEGLGDHGFRRMINQLGLERDWPRTRTQKLRTKEDDLKTYRNLHPAINATYNLVRFGAFMSQDMGARVDRDGWLRCNVLPIAQRTGRNSTVSPNLTGIPGELRPLLLPDDGCVFFLFDYSQQEPGIAGYLANDEAMLSDFGHGDVYENLGLRTGLLRPGMTSEQVRDIRNGTLKPLMLAIIYGMGARSIARIIRGTLHEARMHLMQLTHTYERLFVWLKNYVAVSLHQGWAENIIGYRACYRTPSTQARCHMARSCRNFPIQASAAACFQITGLHLAEFGADIRLPLHDAYLMVVPNDPTAITRAQEWIIAATESAVGQLFPGLAVKRGVEILSRFAKDGKQDSFDKWLTSLEG